jgi:ATP sulfurylase
MVVAASCYGDAFQQQGAAAGRFIKIEGTMNGAKYRQILKEMKIKQSRTL